MSPFGVSVVIDRPGAIKSGWRDVAGESLLRNSGDGPYAKTLKAMYGKFISPEFDKMVADPAVIARAVETALTARRPIPVYTTPAWRETSCSSNTLLATERMRDAFVRRFMNLPSEM